MEAALKKSFARSAVLTTCQTVRFQPSRHLSAAFSASLPTGQTHDILAQTIGMTGTIGMNPYAVLGVSGGGRDADAH